MANNVFFGLPVVCAAIALLTTAVLLARRRYSIPKGIRLPPGPHGLPILGNVADMPKEEECLTFTKWAKEYGDLIYVTLLGKPMIIINSARVAHDLLEARSGLYSDRFEFPMMCLMGTDWFIGQHRYGDKWRWHRKAFRQHFNPIADIAYRDIEKKHTRVLLQKLYDSPEDFLQHVRYLPGAVIMEIVYGIQVLPVDDPYLEIAEKSMKAGAEAGNPGTFLVDVFPILRYVPEWFPGASFRRKARKWREMIIQLPLAPYEAVRAALLAGTATPCVLTSLIEKISSDGKNPEYQEYARNTAASAYVAGADSTVSSLTALVLALVVNQEVQRKAQEELDSVLGDRLPEFDDRKLLPYVNAICKEVFRWAPVFPMGLAHAVIQDDVYGEYFIPRGSIVLPNQWAMLRDEQSFGPDPEEFIPERFLQPGVADPMSFAFGFGRRACPGRQLANDVLFLAAASILKVYTISLAKDENGVDIPVEPKLSKKFISHPAPFICTITPRSPSVASLFSDCSIPE